tara:strand:- start:152854 stop:154566 length:1713 start_codon:yes stop_codon:yes gene_type:complete
MLYFRIDLMKIFVSFLFTLFLTLSVFSQERILEYKSHIEVEASGDILVQEDITVKAERKDIKRGIYRAFPTTYKDKAGTRYKVGFEVVKVLKDGVEEPFFTEGESNGVTVYIGNKMKFLTPDVYTYTLIYRTTRQIGFFEEYDELYFNAIGADWIFPIEKAEVTVTLPEGATVSQLDAFSGTFGSTTCKCTIVSKDNTVRIATDEILLPREQLSFAVAWPKGFIKEPTALEEAGYFFKSNFHVLLAIFGLIIVFWLYYRAWKKVGVDPPKGTIIPLFDPPAGFSPAEVAYLIQMGFTQRAFTAAIVNMGVKGHLKIINLKKKYTLDRVTKNADILSPEENALSTALFSKGDKISLDNKNHGRFTKAKTNAKAELKKKMQPKYFSLNYNYLGKGILASVVLVVFTFVFAPSPAIPIILIILLIVLVAVFTYLIKAPTRKGRFLMDEIEGFKMYLSVAEQKKLDALHEPDMTVERFEALLPYAIALGVENKWGEKFENALSKSLQEVKDYNPSWYAGAAGAMAFSPQQFSSSVGRSFSSAISSASTPPGSSSGSGGGGFSGGGGGGGGGGGW